MNLTAEQKRLVLLLAEIAISNSLLEKYGEENLAVWELMDQLQEREMAQEQDKERAGFEHQHAVMEAHRNAKAEEYFKARHEMLDTIAHRRIFEAGYERGWDERAAPHLQPGYSIDADPHGIRALVADTISGALAFGAQGVNPPPEGHWLEPFWNAARADAAPQPNAALADGWMPMDSCPKTSKARLIYCPSVQCTFAVSWSKDAGQWAVFGGYDSYITQEATMWREMPEPPHA